MVTRGVGLFRQGRREAGRSVSRAVLVAFDHLFGPPRKVAGRMQACDQVGVCHLGAFVSMA